MQRPRCFTPDAPCPGTRARPPRRCARIRCTWTPLNEGTHMRNDITHTRHHRWILLGALIAIAGVAGCTRADADEPEVAASEAAAVAAPMSPIDAELERVREATKKYQDVNVALADGYVRDPADACETADMMGRPAEDGSMGIHYIRFVLLGITEPPNPRVDGTSTYTDFMQPGVLLYEPQADGSLELIAVENLVFIKAWEEA